MLWKCRLYFTSQSRKERTGGKSPFLLDVLPVSLQEEEPVSVFKAGHETFFLMKLCCRAGWCDPSPSLRYLTWTFLFLTWGADGPGLTNLPSAHYQQLQDLLLVIAHGICTASWVSKWLLFAILWQSYFLLLMIKHVNGDNHSCEFFSWWSLIKKKKKKRTTNLGAWLKILECVL